MRKIFCLTASVLLIISLCSCSGITLFPSKERYSANFLDLFDTVTSVIAYDTSQEDFDDHLQQFHDKLEEYHQLFDIYQSYDEITNLYDVNQKAKDGPVPVDSRIIELLEYGKSIYEFTGGKTNICFGSVLSVWHRYRESGLNNPDTAVLPDTEELAAAAEHTNFDDLIIDTENNTVYFADEDLQLDVGALAKGYAAREVCKWAEENLWSSATVSIGGNVCTIGYKEDDGKTLWNIGIENPDTEADDYLVNVSIAGLSVVTSGDYQRYYTVNGKKYCHIIDPDTLMPADYVSAVTVITSDSALGDGLSTALFNMSIDDGKALAEGLDGTEALWVTEDNDVIYSSGFEQYISD